jgi:hypothetical protein
VLVHAQDAELIDEWPSVTPVPMDLQTDPLELAAEDSGRTTWKATRLATASL